MNTLNHAKRELDILIKTTPDAIVRDFVPEILAICKKFGESGQSGGSAPYTASALSQTIKKLCLQNMISPLMGIDKEWNDTMSNNVLQNNRQSDVFKEKETGKCYYLDAIIWKTQSGSTWSGTAENITSRQYIKAFPFISKTFYIDTIEEEISKDNWEFHIKNKKDLEKVWEYYDKYNK